MNNFQMRAFVRQLVLEAKIDKAKEPKKIDKTKEPKKTAKETEPKKKSKRASGNLVEMKKSLAEAKEELVKIDALIADWEQAKNATSNIKYSGTDIETGADEKEKIVDLIDEEIEKLKKEKENIQNEASSLEESTLSEINRIKEMMGLIPEAGQEKMMGEKKKITPAQKDKEKMMGENKGTKNFTYTDASGKIKFVTADNIDQAKEKAKKFGADPKTVKEKIAPLPIAPKK